MEDSQKVNDHSTKETSNGKSRYATQQSTESQSGQPPAKKCMIAEIILLCVVMVVIWVALTLPLVFFYLPVEDVALPMLPGQGNASLEGNLSMMLSMNFSSEMIDEDDNFTDSVVGSAGNELAFQCNDNFFPVDSPVCRCVPRCPDWRQYSTSLSVLIDKVVLTCACIGVLSAIAVLIIACVRHKEIFVFPSIFIVYLTITLLILVTFFVINFIDREALFCNSVSLIESLRSPTTFCVIAGFVFYYSLIQMTLWWLFHIATLFWIFRFPLHFRSFQKLKRIKYVHITCVILGIVIPILPIVIAVGDHAMDVKRNDSLTIPSGYGFGMTNLPPILCSGLDSDVSFYAVVLPILVMTEIGMTLLVFAFWDVRKVHTYSFRRRKRRRGALGSGEKKIVIVLLYYTFLVEFALTAFTLAMRSVTQFQAAIRLHFFCECQGYNLDTPCDRSQMESLRFPGVSLVAYMLLVLFPVINFTYVINFRKVKLWFYRFVLRKEGSSITSTSYSVAETVNYSTQFSRMNSTCSAINHAVDVPASVKMQENVAS